ncbi:MAG: TetR/AcrR family transcriptional regulator [Myxococcaceae bacterium]|nr:TetR/AcrR family transcriptional regulator [Myxococcaceae bacterium]
MRDKQREETRRRIYLAALEIFRRDGVAQCRIEDIAQKSEVSRGAFYFHFPTKDDVLLELLRESQKPMVAKLLEIPKDAPLETTLETLSGEMAAFWAQDAKLLPDVAAVALRATPLILDREGVVVRDVLSKSFVAAAERGELSDVLPPEVLADFYLSNSLAAMMAWCANPMLPLEVVLKGVSMLFLKGASGAGR